jgi:hypothetical protein
VASKCGHRGLGRKLSEFDAREVEMGLQEEREHSCVPEEITQTVLDHLAEDSQYYTKLRRAFQKNSRSRPKIYDARDIAKNYSRTFKDREVEYEKKVKFTWPRYLQHVGDNLGQAYDSDKWKKGSLGKRDWELYKHVAESRNKFLCVPGFLADEDTGTQVETIGPTFDTFSWPMPNAFADLALFTEANIQLHTAGTNSSPGFGRGSNSGIVAIAVRHGFIGCSKILWSREDKSAEDQPFLFVYTENDGVMFLVVGESLDIEKDGIVG